MTEKEAKQKWIEALRSGNYSQTKHTLKGTIPGGGVGYCCLGVYAEAVMGVKLRAVQHKDPDEVDHNMGEALYYDEGPDGVYVDLREVIPCHVLEAGISMNDGGKPFSEIADMIEKEWDT